MKHTIRRSMNTWNKSNISFSVLLTDKFDNASIVSMRENRFQERYITQRVINDITKRSIKNETHFA